MGSRRKVKKNEIVRNLQHNTKKSDSVTVKVQTCVGEKQRDCVAQSLSLSCKVRPTNGWLNKIAEKKSYDTEVVTTKKCIIVGRTYRTLEGHGIRVFDGIHSIILNECLHKKDAERQPGDRLNGIPGQDSLEDY